MNLKKDTDPKVREITNHVTCLSIQWNYSTSYKRIIHKNTLWKTVKRDMLLMMMVGMRIETKNKQQKAHETETMWTVGNHNYVMQLLKVVCDINSQSKPLNGCHGKPALTEPTKERMTTP